MLCIFIAVFELKVHQTIWLLEWQTFWVRENTLAEATETIQKLLVIQVLPVKKVQIRSCPANSNFQDETV